MEQPNNQKEFCVSVVIPAYNIEDHISRAIKSVLLQTRTADEIIVVDDGSTDNTSVQIKNFGSQVHYIHQSNAGLSSARNTGIKAASCQWIAFLDGDDQWLPEYLHQQLSLLQRNKQLFWSTGNYLRCLCAENRRALDQPPNKLQKLLKGKEFFHDYLTAYVLGAGGHPDTMVIKRHVLLEAGLFLEGLKRAEDMDMWFRIAYRYPEIGFVTRPLAIYHLQRPGALSTAFTPAKLYCDLIERQLSFAQQCDRRKAFEPVASHLLRGWTRSMLFDARGADIRSMIAQFDNLLSARYRRLMYLLTSFPRITAGACHIISRVVHTLHLRRQLQRKP